MRDLCPLSCDEKGPTFDLLGHLAIGDGPAGTYILCRFLKVSMATLNRLVLLLKLQAACASLPVMKRSRFFLLTQSVADKSGNACCSVVCWGSSDVQVFQEAEWNSFMRVWDQS